MLFCVQKCGNRAVCTGCQGEMGIPGLIDKNVQEIDEQYRAAEGIVSIDDIERLMKLYKIGKAPLSLALGFGEITIPRYLEGQVPSKEYSDIIKASLSSPAYMKQKLMENREKLTDAAYRKAFAAAESIESLFSVSDKVLRVIAYIFEKLEEVTPLMLQKLLHFIKILRINLSLFNKIYEGRRINEYLLLLPAYDSLSIPFA